MQQTITITPQWQVYIPQKIRAAVGLDRPSKATMVADKGDIVIRPKESAVLKLAGKYKHRAHLAKKKGINIDKIRDYIDYSNLL